jgi:hypothetical protein
VPTFRNKNVAGLDVAVDDALCVGGVQGFRHLNGQGGLKRPSGNAVR